MLDLIEKIAENLRKDPTNRQIYKDLCSVARELLKTDEKSGVKWLKWLAERCEEMVSKTFARDLGMAREFVSLHKQVLLATAPYDFDSYCLYLEFNRDPEKKFYLPRRKFLRVLVEDLQDLSEGKIDFLGISLPPRVGKSTLCIFFMTWIMGKRPDVASVMSGHSDK